MEVNKLQSQSEYKQYMKVRGRVEENGTSQIVKKSHKDAKDEGNKENISD